MRKLSVHTYPSNEDSTRVKQKIRILDHQKKLIDVICGRLAISGGLTVNNIKTGPNQYRFTWTLLDGEVLRIFDLKATELSYETATNRVLVMDHVVTYFGPKECLSKQKRYICYKMENPRKITTRQYVGFVRDINSRMVQMPPLFDENQQLDESKLVDSLADKAPKSHKAMLILQSFNRETGYLATFEEHC